MSETKGVSTKGGKQTAASTTHRKWWQFSYIDEIDKIKPRSLTSKPYWQQNKKSGIFHERTQFTPGKKSGKMKKQFSSQSNLKSTHEL